MHLTCFCVKKINFSRKYCEYYRMFSAALEALTLDNSMERFFAYFFFLNKNEVKQIDVDKISNVME